MKQRVKLGKWRQVISYIKNKRAVEVDRECLVVEEGGEERVVTEDVEVAEAYLLVASFDKRLDYTDLDMNTS